MVLSKTGQMFLNKWIELCPGVRLIELWFRRLCRDGARGIELDFVFAQCCIEPSFQTCDFFLRIQVIFELLL